MDGLVWVGKVNKNVSVLSCVYLQDNIYIGQNGLGEQAKIGVRANIRLTPYTCLPLLQWNILSCHAVVLITLESKFFVRTISAVPDIPIFVFREDAWHCSREKIWIIGLAWELLLL